MSTEQLAEHIDTTLAEIHQLTTKQLQKATIESTAKRITLNFRNSAFYRNRAGIQPVEIRLERISKQSPWEIRFIATFDYPDHQASGLDVALYFNFRHRWFYQPDIERCELHRPEVADLFHSWQQAFLRHLSQGRFDSITLTTASHF
ncbi:hypothetical protein CGJ66_22560 [Vibrio parahaemolyticus]|uniref:DUF2787 family protein n=1 Tax=Vibrio parahaemolyticus TaxID=670 RepID=UPI0011243A7C|nr:DUF2787 family protein [Vibrio parahaemolyticus]TOD30836.1 hypothetical protein CGJ66_22560 [Vibrio parahaemolyticus]